MAQQSPVEYEVNVGSSVSRHCISDMYLSVCHKSHCRDASLWKRAEENNEPLWWWRISSGVQKRFLFGDLFLRTPFLYIKIQNWLLRWEITMGMQNVYFLSSFQKCSQFWDMFLFPLSPSQICLLSLLRCPFEFLVMTAGSAPAQSMCSEEQLSFRLISSDNVKLPTRLKSRSSQCSL